MIIISRRKATKLISSAASGILLSSGYSIEMEDKMKSRKIPSTGELLPVVGLGTWQTFDVGNNQQMRHQLAEVLQTLKSNGGKIVDSSPMYGSSEEVVGDLTASRGIQGDFFYATKVWISGKQAGIDQMETSMERMRRKQMDLMQIHNLVDWQTHIKTLRAWKEVGKIRYWGITHYTNSAHDKLESIIKNHKPDFVQFNYSINSRHAESRLLPAAKDSGAAVIINQPYNGGSLFGLIKGKTVPEWCHDLDINSWGQYFLKYILSNPAVTCVIPGTSKPHHMADNAKAGFGALPDEKTRKKMVDYLNML